MSCHEALIFLDHPLLQHQLEELLQQHQGEIVADYRLLGENRIDCRNSPPSPPFILTGGETERHGADCLLGTKGLVRRLSGNPQVLFCVQSFLCSHAEELRVLVQFHLISAMAGRGLKHGELDGTAQLLRQG